MIARFVSVQRATIERVRWLMFVNLLITILAAPFVGWSTTAILAIVAMYFVYDCLGIVVTNHRFWSHRSFEFRHPAIKYVMTTIALFSGAGSTLGWAGLHRLHHTHSDTAQDPHNSSCGFWKTVFLFYRGSKRNLVRVSLDNASDRFIRETDRWWGAIMGVWIVALGAISLEVLYFGFIVPSLLTMFAQGMTNYANHSRAGYRNHETGDQSINCPWIAPFNWGEAWHNNHHAAPESSSTQQRWWEIDIAGLIIKAIAR
jgi:fatty-acid desaturase